MNGLGAGGYASTSLKTSVHPLKGSVIVTVYVPGVVVTIPAEVSPDDHKYVKPGGSLKAHNTPRSITSPGQQFVQVWFKEAY